MLQLTSGCTQAENRVYVCIPFSVYASSTKVRDRINERKYLSQSVGFPVNAFSKYPSAADSENVIHSVTMVEDPMYTHWTMEIPLNCSSVSGRGTTSSLTYESVSDSEAYEACAKSPRLSSC